MVKGKVFKILVADPVGFIPAPLAPGHEADFKAHVEAHGGTFHYGPILEGQEMPGLNVSYQPNLTTKDITAEADKGCYDMLVVAAKPVEPEARFPKGAVRMGTGINTLPTEVWQAKNIPVMNVPGGNAVAAAHETMHALMHAVGVNIDAVERRVLEDPTFTTAKIIEHPSRTVEGLRIAIIGSGDIGSELARLAKAHRMKVTMYSRNFGVDDASNMGINHARSLEDAVSGADVVSLHLPENAASKGIINADIFRQCKDGVIILNYARGPVIDAGSLQQAMDSRKVSFVAVDSDIFGRSAEGTIEGPLKPYARLKEQFPDRVLLQPHIAVDANHDVRVALAKQAFNQARGWLQENTVVNSNFIPNGAVDGGKKKPSIGEVTGAEIVAVINHGRTPLEELKRTLERVLHNGDGIVAEDATDVARALNLVNNQIGDVLGRKMAR